MFRAICGRRIKNRQIGQNLKSHKADLCNSYKKVWYYDMTWYIFFSFKKGYLHLNNTSDESKANDFSS